MISYKKASFLFLFLILFLFTLPGCNLVEPIKKLPSEKPKDFGFVFNYGVDDKSQLDTINGLFTQYMVIEPSTTTELKLSDEEMNTIYLKMKKINILNYPETFITKSKTLQTPYDTYFIKIAYDDKVKKYFGLMQMKLKRKRLFS